MGKLSSNQVFSRSTICWVFYTPRMTTYGQIKPSQLCKGPFTETWNGTQ